MGCMCSGGRRVVLSSVADRGWVCACILCIQRGRAAITPSTHVILRGGGGSGAHGKDSCRRNSFPLQGPLAHIYIHISHTHAPTNTVVVPIFATRYIYMYIQVHYTYTENMLYPLTHTHQPFKSIKRKRPPWHEGSYIIHTYIYYTIRRTAGADAYIFFVYMYTNICVYVMEETWKNGDG